ncbi:MAG: hypothetical protein FJ214_09335 [Ignavibacteria bacterium]|nr:hypothetical protein [Ignavibacteria bacterium]
MFTRDEFNNIKSISRRTVKRYSFILAFTSVVLGLCSLWFLKWVDLNFTSTVRIVIALSTFLIFLIVVGLLVIKLKHVTKLSSPKCPHCGISLIGDSLRIVSATSRCDSCGGQVIG